MVKIKTTGNSVKMEMDEKAEFEARIKNPAAILKNPFQTPFGSKLNADTF